MQLPVRCSRLAFERADNIGGYSAAVKSSRLRLDAFTVDEAGDTTWIEGNEVSDTTVTRRAPPLAYGTATRFNQMFPADAIITSVTPQQESHLQCQSRSI